MEEIKFQRRVELWSEGFSNHDHITWDEPLDHEDSGVAESCIKMVSFREDHL